MKSTILTVKIIMLCIYFSDFIEANIGNTFDIEIKCTLTESKDYKPFPSLSRCYKHNKSACCNSVNDDYIDSQLVGLLTTSCDRRFPALEDLFCLGCNPLESIYTNSTKKEIYICEGYANYFWNNTPLNQSSTIFDSCGFKPTDALKDYATQDFVMPSKAFQNFTDFLTKIKVPYYEDYSFLIVPDNETCFGDVAANFFGLSKNHLFKIVMLLFFLEFLF